jgi:hypothetical protein
MSIKFTDENPAPKVNEMLIADKLKTSQVYDVVVFKELDNETILGDPTPRKMSLEKGVLKIEGGATLDLKLCKCEWKNGNTILSIYPEDNFSIDIHFD